MTLTKGFYFLSEGMNLNIRRALPQDAFFLAWVILAAGRAHGTRGIWDIVLDGAEEERLSFLKLLTVTEEAHLFHYAGFLVAESDKGPVAGLGGYDPRALGFPALQRVLPEVYERLGRNMPDKILDERSKRVLGCIPEDVEGAWMVHSVATLPEARRRGIMDRLLEQILGEGRRRGFRRAQINIYIGNIPALRGYEKHGFKVLDEKRDAVFEDEIGSPGMARLLLDL